MRQLSRHNAMSTMISGALVIAMLGACRPKSPEAPPASATATAALPAEVTVTEAAPPADEAPMDQSPELRAMLLASSTSKLGVPVDLRYSFDGAVEAGRPVTLHIAAIPRAEGSNLSVTIKEDPGIQASAAPITAQKASAGTAYRRQLSVTRLAGGPAELRVLVTMDMPIGQAHSWFSVPLNPPASATKQDPVKMQ